ncbi:MAG TPA: metal-dependent hydrolase [Burkholderiaceae bacterium]|nr:metal-dependent hydrolase [Burkholderiaceae bacterium]
MDDERMNGSSQSATGVAAILPGAVYWTPNTARARWFDAISLLLPAGETFVIEAVRDACAAWPAHDALRKAVQHLIDEEHAHQRAHDRYNERLAAVGLPVGALTDRLASMMAPMRAWPLEERVLMAAALEQCTALLSREVLRNRAWLGPHESATTRMWRWHCEEEIGHHGTAIALAAIAPRRIWTWPLILVLAAVWLTSDILRFQSALRATDLRLGRVGRWQSLRDSLQFAAQTAPGVARLLAGGIRSVFLKLPGQRR